MLPAQTAGVLISTVILVFNPCPTQSRYVSRRGGGQLNLMLKIWGVVVLATLQHYTNTNISQHCESQLQLKSVSANARVWCISPLSFSASQGLLRTLRSFDNTTRLSEPEC